MIRVEAGVAKKRFCELIGVPRPTYYRWLSATGAAKGPWPAPVVDLIEAYAAKQAERWDAWGHRKIWALLQADGHSASQSSVKRALARRELLLPVRYQTERRQLAKARRAAFVDAPTRRNRVWQLDFSQLESLAGGVWRMGGICDYVAKVCFCCRTSTTENARDAVATLEAARLRAEELLGHPLLDDLVDFDTGELVPIIVVTDNGGAFRSATFARYIAARPEFAHVRTRHRSPQTNGVIERFFESIKYEHLYRREISDGVQLAQEIDNYLAIFNQIRPHETLGFKIPMNVYLARPRWVSDSPLRNAGSCLIFLTRNTFNLR